MEALAAQESRSNRGFSIALLGLALITGVALQQFGPASISQLFTSLKLESAGGLGALACALVAAVLAHESGHLIAALAMKFAITGASLGPFRVARLGGQWTASFSLRSFQSASVSAIPRQMDSWRSRLLVVIAAGPVATLLTGSVACLLFANAAEQSWTRNFLAAFCQVSLYIFVLGLVPNRSDARVRNDMRLFLTVLRDTPESHEIFLYNWIGQQQFSGTRPRDLPQELIRELQLANARPDFAVLFARNIAAFATDSEDLVEAELWHRQALSISQKCDGRTQRVVEAEYACYCLLFKDDISSASARIADFDTALLTPPSLAFRAKAVQAFCQGNGPAVLAAIAQARFVLGSASAHYAFEYKLLSMLQAKVSAFRFITPPHQNSNSIGSKLKHLRPCAS